MSLQLAEGAKLGFSKACLSALISGIELGLSMSPEKTISLLIADSQRLVAEGIASGLSRYADLRVLDQHPDSGVEALAMAARLKPDVALVEYWMPDMEGNAVAGALRIRVPQCRVIVVSSRFGPEEVKAALQAGAVGFLPKTVGIELVADAARRAYAGESPVYSSELESMVGELEHYQAASAESYEKLVSLTPREQQILRLLSPGPSVQDVASQLFIATSTVKTHINHILAKTGHKRIRPLVSMARDCGWLRE